ncbi:MAG: hypothetical protein CENE_01862 [Candidatus Celerinatantimonas neptuna]|nr:MAG: hypothetical protein CENE_01862 [Candidatus Celerinatantimonas neptuna]
MDVSLADALFVIAIKIIADTIPIQNEWWDDGDTFNLLIIVSVNQ